MIIIKQALFSVAVAVAALAIFQFSVWFLDQQGWLGP
jgi:hypothetical protein